MRVGFVVGRVWFRIRFQSGWIVVSTLYTSRETTNDIPITDTLHDSRQYLNENGRSAPITTLVSTFLIIFKHFSGTQNTSLPSCFLPTQQVVYTPHPTPPPTTPTRPKSTLTHLTLHPSFPPTALTTPLLSSFDTATSALTHPVAPSPTSPSCA